MNQRGDVFRKLLLIQLGKTDEGFRLFELFHMLQSKLHMKEIRIKAGNPALA